MEEKIEAQNKIELLTNKPMRMQLGDISVLGLSQHL